MKPEPEDDFSEPDATARLGRVEEQLAVSAIRADFGLSDEQARKVHGIVKSSDLSSVEAFEIARKRHADLFQHTAADGVQFGSLAPRGRGAPPQKPDDAVRRRKYVDSLRRTDAATRNRYLDNMVGGHLADALGWEHQLLPLPPQ